jgi:NAD(P)-dependent dehydrogenase (short-subunit alcohol dehydrogenase family)
MPDAPNRKTVIVTGASQGIGAGIVRAFLARGYNVVGTSRHTTKSKDLSPSERLALIDGDIGQFETAQKTADLATEKFGSIDALVANAGIYLVKPFTEYTRDDFRALVSTNLEGFIYIAQLAVKQMQAQKSGGSIVCITAALADNPIAGSPASVAMMTKGGLNAIVKSLSSEYAREHIRFNAVAPGVVDSPLHANTPKELLEKLTPMASISTVEDVANAVVYLTEATQVTGEVLHVDGGAHVGKW